MKDKREKKDLARSDRTNNIIVRRIKSTPDKKQLAKTTKGKSGESKTLPDEKQLAKITSASYNPVCQRQHQGLVNRKMENRKR